ncbi:MAG TPA: RES family NAD+ phosphorylase [Mucilaginibacter sp.]
MILYRLTKCIYTDLSGLGARLYGGRWNSEGRSMVYLTSSRSLAVLEALVHLSPTNLPNDYCMMTIDVPDSITEIDLQLLPHNWHEYPEQNGLKQIGNNFIRENKYLLLKVPSAIVKEEYNYLMNPLHPQSATVKILSNQPFYFDQRLTAE